MPSEERSKHYKEYGWKCSEDNLKTLPASAPQPAKDLAKWLTLEGRRSSLAEWIGQVGPDGRIHGKTWHIGAWTGRSSHSAPNLANIPAIPDRKPVTDVECIKAMYDYKLRELFHSGDAWLVGCDADGIQLRVLAHYMGSSDYVDAITKGDKAAGTDIHNLNKSALGMYCKSRDDAKTFIYAWLLGAGTAKIASILGCNERQARQAVHMFLGSLPELKRLRVIDIPNMVTMGGFDGLDGRWVPCISDHLMLAGMLQNGEAVIMKHANVLWYHKLKSLGVRFKQVNFVHDEWQTIVFGPKRQAEMVGRLQAAALHDVGCTLSMRCPISGSYKVGKNWKETH